MNAEVKSQQQLVKVKIKTVEVNSEIEPHGDQLAKRALVPPEEGAATPDAKRRRVGGAAPSGGAFCRRSRPQIPPPPAAAEDDRQDRMAIAAVGDQPAVDFASAPGQTGPHPREVLQWEVQLARLADYKMAHGNCNVPRGWADDPKLASWFDHQRLGKQTAARAAQLRALGFEWSPARSLRCPRCRAEEEGHRYTGPHWADRICDATPGGPTMLEMDAELRRLNLPTHRSKRALQAHLWELGHEKLKDFR